MFSCHGDVLYVVAEVIESYKNKAVKTAKKIIKIKEVACLFACLKQLHFWITIKKTATSKMAERAGGA